MQVLQFLLIACLTCTLSLSLPPSSRATSPPALTWTWSYTSPESQASGTLTTAPTPDDRGFFPILNLSGTHNGQTITSLAPTGSPIPGNEPYALDNAIHPDPPHLTKSGFGFATAQGNYVNLFFADFLDPPGFLEVFSAPPFVEGSENLGPEDHEVAVTFTATIVPTGDSSPRATRLPLWIGLGSLGSAGLGWLWFRRRHDRPLS